MQNNNNNDDEERKRKQRELEQRNRELEAKRRQERIDAQTKAMEDLAKQEAAKRQQAEQKQTDMRNKKFAQVEEVAHPTNATTSATKGGVGRGFDTVSNPTSRAMDNLPQSNSRQAYKKWYEGENVKKYKDYSNSLGEDIRNTIEYSRAAGLKDDEIKNSLIPQEDNTIEQRLEEIGSKLKPGRESWGQTMQEGWYEKELQDMLSKETLRQMNGLPNKADTIQKWMAEHPELSISENANIVDKGIRFLAEGTKQKVDSYSAAAKHWESWAIAGAIVAGASLLAPVTGGTSLLVGGTLLGNSVLALGSLGALKLGMSYGSVKYMSELEMADKYNQYIQEGVHPDIAKTQAATVGAVNGLIEFMQIDSAFSTIPGVANLLDNGKKLAGKEFTKQLTKVAANYGVDLLGNALEESAQEATGLMGLELSKYLENAPNPNTLEGLKVLAKTFDKEDYRERVIQSGIDALQSMWLSPIVSSGVRQGASMSVNSAITKSQSKKVNGYYTAEERQSQEFNDAQKKMLLTDTEENQIDLLIKDYNESRDERTLAAMVTTEQVLDAISQREDTTNQEKELIQKSRNKINNIVSKAMYDAKDENTDIEYKPTNNIDIETEILSPEFEGEIYTQGFNDYAIERYNDAKKTWVLDTIKEELLKGTSKAEIASKITKALPRKMRGPLDVATMINAIETVQKEVNAQKVMNNIHNYEQMKDYKPVNVEVDVKEDVKQEDIQEVTEQPTEEVLGATDVIAQVDTENATESLVEPTEDVYNPDDIADIESDVMNFLSEEERERVNNELIDRDIASGKIPTDDFRPLDDLEWEEYKKADVVKVPVNKVFKDEKRFQFRYYGTTNKLDGATFDQDLSGPLMLVRDKFGDLYVFNGHHRLRLAEQSGVEYIDARIYDSKDYTDEEVRALGALVNIAENHAEAIDVAKVLRDSTLTTDELKKYLSPRSKIMKDGIALSNLNDWIFTQVATNKISQDIGVVIGNELPGDKAGQNQIIKAIDKLQVQGKDITTNILTEMIAEVKGTAQETFTEQTLFGEETFTKSVEYERATLVGYVKEQLKSKKSLLKSVTKDKNASMLESLGNKIAADENTEQLEQSELALLLLDKTLNYQGTKVNELFNRLALEYSQAEPKDRAAIKRKALDELISLMEGGNLLGENATTKQRKQTQGIDRGSKDSRTDGEGRQESRNDSSQTITEEQEQLIGQEALFALREQPQVEIIADDDVKNTRAYKATIKIVEALQKNVFFNGLKVNYSNKSGKIVFDSKKELKEHGYEHYEVGKTYYIYGAYDNRTRTITLNSEAARDTILEEAIHDIQSRIQEINPELGVTIQAWETEVREQAAALGYEIPGGYELLAQALVFSELGYASSNKQIAELIAVDDEIVRGIKAILGRDVLKEGQGLVESETAKKDRELKGMYENYAKRIFTQDGFLDNLLEAEENRKTEIRAELANARAATYYHPSNGQYVIVSPSTKGAKYQVTTFSPKFGPISDGQYDTIDEVADSLVEDKFYYKANEIHYQLKDYTRGTVDRLYARATKQMGFLVDQQNDSNIEISDNEIIELYGDARIGNLQPVDFDNLILNNKNILGITKVGLVNRINEAVNKGLNVPNSEVRMGQYLNRFYNIPLDGRRLNTKDNIETKIRYNGDNGKLEVINMSWGKNDVLSKEYRDHIGSRVVTVLYTYDTLEDAVDGYLKLMDKAFSIDDKELYKINKKYFLYTNKTVNDLKDEYQQFTESIETYRNKGIETEFTGNPHYAISYQLKDKAATDTPEFKNWFKDSKVVDEEGKPLVVYHGTPNKFSTFDNEQIGNHTGNLGFYGKGLYFTGHEFTAGLYGENIMQVYLNISKPFVIDNYTDLDILAELAETSVFDGTDNNFYNIEETLAGNEETFTNNLIKQGYDGIIVNKRLGVHDLDKAEIVVFKPTQIKSIYNNGMFNEYDPNINYQLKNSSPVVDVPGFYSNLENVINTKMGKRAKASDVMNMLTKNGVKPEELEWFEIANFIEGKDFVYKDELIEHMANKSIEFTTENMGGEFSSYTLDGGDNYRFNAYIYKNNPGKPFINNAHFGRLENVIAHTRYKDRVGVNGEKILLIEELQSDWHQKGRQEGYEVKVQATLPEGYTITNINDNLWRIYKNGVQVDYVLNNLLVAEFGDSTEESAMRYVNMYFNNEITTYKVADAPLKESITDFLIKQAIKDAVEGGYDYMAWTTGTQQADRYNMRKVIDQLEVLVNPSNKTYEVYAKKGGATQLHQEGLSEQELADTFGKEIASKIVEDARPIFSNFSDVNEPLQLKTYKDLDLETGGEFYKKLYDNYVPRMLKKYGKKWGLNVGNIDIISMTEDKVDLAEIISEMNDYEITQLAFDKGFDYELRELMTDAEIDEEGFLTEVDNYSQRRDTLEKALLDSIPDNLINQPSIPVTPQMIEDVITQGQPLFQLKEVPKTNGELLAIHNLSEENLKNVIKLGGFPMPSIAVVKTNYNHDAFGDISILFNKDTIDPQYNRYNKLYGGDAYTPTFPRVEYKISEKVAESIRKRIYQATEYTDYRKVFNSTFDDDNMSDKVNRRGSFAEAYSDDPLLMLTYLKEKGIPFEPVIKYKNYGWDLDLLEILSNEFKEIITKGYISVEQADSIAPRLRELINKYYGIELYKEPLEFGQVDRIVDAIREYSTDDLRTEINRWDTEKKLNEEVDKEDFTKWLDEISTGIIEKEGFRNNKDLFTPSGNRRSWDALHDEVTLDKIVKAMRSEDDVAAGNWFGTGQFIAASSKNYKTIQEMKQDSDRLTNLDDAEYQAIKDEYSNRLVEIAGKMIVNDRDNRFIAIDNAVGAIIDALQNSKSRAGMLKILQEYRHLNVTGEILDEIMQLSQETANMPTQYFEAKPKRAVYLNEIQAVIAPDTLSLEVEQMLKDNGINLVEKYSKENDTARQQAMDNVLRQNDVSFQLKEADTTTKEFKNWFGDSKVVDEEGNPLVVYHGTNRMFDNFDYGRNRTILNSSYQGDGIFFTPSKYVANEYSKAGRNQSIDRQSFLDALRNKYGDRIADLALEYIENGYPEDESDSSWEERMEMFKYAEGLGVDINTLLDLTEWVEGSKSARPSDNINIFANKKMMPEYVNKKLYELGLYESMVFPRTIPVYLSIQNLLTTNNREEARNARANGYDGVLYNGEGTVGGQPEYIVFNPTQIKSVYNYGAWDVNDANIYYQLKEEPDMKERSWGQTVRDASITQQWLKDLLTSNKFLYEVKHNEDTLIAAAQLIDTKGEEYIEARLLSDLDNDAVLMAASQILTYKYMESGEQDRAMAMLDKTAEKATSLGQAIQILSVWGRQTPEGMLRYTSQAFRKLITDKDRQEIADKVKALTDEFNRLNRQAIKEIDLVGTINQVQQMTPEELATRDIASKGGTLPEGGFTPEMLQPFTNTIDDGMRDRIIDTINAHYEGSKGNLVDKLQDLGLNEVQARTITNYTKEQIKTHTKAGKEVIINSKLTKKKYERKGLVDELLDVAAKGQLDMTTTSGMDETRLRNLIGEKEGMPVLSKELVDYIYQQGQHINSLPQGRQRDVETAKMIQVISDHMPVSFWTKVKTFQTIAQLLNFKTTIRNLVGNDMFRRLDTFTLNFLGTPIDAALAKATGNSRSMLFRPIKANQAQKLGYKEGWRLGLEDSVLGINTSDLDTQYELRSARVFKTGILAEAEKVLNIALRATDRAAVMATFRDSLAEQMELTGVDTATEEMTENAMAIALYRTFQDDTTLSQMFSTLKKGLNKIGSKDGEFGLGELIMKYPKTPANILGRAIDYSPAGVVVTALKLARDTSPKGSYLRQRMKAEGWSRAIMGTGLIATGAILARMGILTGSNPDDDEDIYKLQKQYGLRDFSVNVSALFRHIMSGFTDSKAGELKKGDIIASYDWAEPIAMPLAVGADTILGSGETKDILSTAIRAAETGATTLTDQPLLTGLSTMFRDKDPMKGLTEIAKGIPSSFTPSLFAHVAQFLDGRDTDPYTFYDKGRQAYNLVANRTPILRSALPSRYTTLGDEKRYYPENMNYFTRFINTFLNPSIASKYMPPKEAEFIFDLYNSTQDGDIVPRPPQKTYSIPTGRKDSKGKGISDVYSFTPESWEEMSNWLGDEYKSRIGYAMNTYMKGWSAEEQAEEIKFIIKQVKDEAKEKAMKIGKKVN